MKNFVAEGDGDYHIRFIVTDKSLVNAKNQSEQGGALVLEPVCQNKPTQSDAIQPCQGLQWAEVQHEQVLPWRTRQPSGARPREARKDVCVQESTTD